RHPGHAQGPPREVGYRRAAPASARKNAAQRPEGAGGKTRGGAQAGGLQESRSGDVEARRADESRQARRDAEESARKTARPDERPAQEAGRPRGTPQTASEGRAARGRAEARNGQTGRPGQTVGKAPAVSRQ